MSNTELEGGLIGPSVKVLSHTLDRLLEREAVSGVEGGKPAATKPFPELKGPPVLASLTNLLNKFDPGESNPL